MKTTIKTPAASFFVWKKVKEFIKDLFESQENKDFERLKNFLTL